MGINVVMKRLLGNKRIDNRPSHEKLQPEEVELRSYQERERLQHVKRKLAIYRKQDYDEMFGKGKILTNEKKKSILNQPNVFNQKNVFKHSNVFSSNIKRRKSK